MKTSIIIPARYGSSRYKGKPLAKILGRQMILRVADICKKIKIDKISNKFFEKYDFFINLGVSSLVALLDQKGINYLQLINPDKLIDGFDLSKNKIINLDDLKNYNKIKKKSYEKNNNEQIFKMANKIFRYKNT